MDTTPKHSIVQLFIILSSVLLIIAELHKGEVAERWNMAAYITITAEIICWQFLRKSPPKDPLKRYHKLLDCVCIIVTSGVLLLKCVDLLDVHHNTTTRALAIVGILTIFTIIVWIIASMKAGKRNSSS